MTTIEISAQKDKTTKNFERFRFEHESINGSLYLPKGVNKLKVIVEYEWLRFIKEFQNRY